jgi:hypothetical protein
MHMEMKEYIKKAHQIITQYYNLHKSFPTFEWLMKRFNTDRLKIVRILSALERDNLIKKNGTRWVLLQKSEDVAKQKKVEPIQVKPPPPPVNWDHISIIIIRIVMGFVGFGATLISIYLTAQKFDLTLSTFFAWLFSIILVLFLVFIFEAIIIMIRNKRYLIAFFLSFSFLIAMAYSMNSTTEIQYLKRTIAYEEENKIDSSTVNNQIIYDDVLSQINRKDKEIGIAYSDKERIDNLLDMFSKDEETRTKRWSYYLTTKSEAETNRALIESLNLELNELLLQKKELLNNQDSISENSRIDRPSYYALIAGALNQDIFLVEFIIDTIPAVFLDIISPIAIGLALFLNDEKKKKSNFILNIWRDYVKKINDRKLPES